MQPKKIISNHNIIIIIIIIINGVIEAQQPELKILQ